MTAATRADVGTSAGSEAEPGQIPDAVKRIETVDDLLDANWELLEESLRKAVGNGRMTDPKREKARQGWHNAANRHIDQMRKLLDTREMATQALEIEEIKANAGVDN